MNARVHANPETVWKPGTYPLNQAVAEPAGRRVHLTGQVAWDADGRVDGVGDAGRQTEVALENIRKVLGELGGCLSDVISLTTYFVRDADKDAISRARAAAFAKPSVCRNRHKSRRAVGAGVACRTFGHRRDPGGSISGAWKDGSVTEMNDRMGQMEEDVRDIRRGVSEMNDRMGRMEIGIAKIQARVEMLPTVWTFVVALVATVFTAVGVVIAVISAFQP